MSRTKSRPVQAKCQCGVYGATVVFITGCSVDVIGDVLQDAFGLVVDWQDYEESAQGYNLEVTVNGQQVWIVWVKDSSDVSTLMHECIHLAISILCNRGVDYTEGKNESLTYYAEYWFGIFCQLIAEGVSMPYKRKGKCVHNAKTGKKKGCSKTVAGAKRYMRALYANTKDKKK